jgi:hypothetical protein
MRVKAKLTRVSYTDRGKPIVEFSMDQCYLALEKLDGTFTVCDNRHNPTKFTRDEFHQLFKIIDIPESGPRTLYVIEYGSHYDSDPWQNIGYANSKEEAQEFINKQFCPSLYHCRELKHISKVKKED